jgi:hypothetical protein
VKKTLFLLCQPVDRIDPSLFLPLESQGDVVLLDHDIKTPFSYKGGTVFVLQNRDGQDGLSYDDLVEKIFQNDSTIVI